MTGTPATIKPLPLFGYLDLWSGPLPARRRGVFGPIRARKQSSPIQTLRHFENEFCQALKAPAVLLSMGWPCKNNGPTTEADC